MIEDRRIREDIMETHQIPSFAEVLELAKLLPREEREKVVAELSRMAAALAPSASKPPWEEFGHIHLKKLPRSQLHDRYSD